MLYSNGEYLTYDLVLALMIVDSNNGKTVDWIKIFYQILLEILNIITSEVKNVKRVVYDINLKTLAMVVWK